MADTAAPVGHEQLRPVYLGRLSDEELVLLEAQHPLVLLPRHETLSETEQDWAVGSALRCFAARGVEIGDDGQLALPQHLQDVLEIRAGAERILLVQVLLPPDSESGEAISDVTLHYAYVIDEVVVLEDVAGNGLHDFWALDLDGLPDAMQERVPTGGARDGQDPAYVLDLMQVAAGDDLIVSDRIGAVVCQVDATAWHAPQTPEPVLQAVLLGDRGTYLSRAVAGTEGPVRLTPVPVQEVGREVVRLLDPDTMTG